MQTRSTSLAELAASSRSSIKLIRSVCSLPKLARRMVSGWAAAWIPRDKFDQNTGLAASCANDSRASLLLIIAQDVTNATHGANQFHFTRKVNFVA